MDEDSPPTDPKEARVFSQVITGLQKSYPREKMEEISTSFCFICLLHLANEQGLKLESTADGLGIETGMEGETSVVGDDGHGEPINEEKKVGNIWDLKVCFFFIESVPVNLTPFLPLQIYRDPNATQAA